MTLYSPPPNLKNTDSFDLSTSPILITEEDILSLNNATSEPQEPITFPALPKFQEIIKSLSNWKAAGLDEIFYIFIKKLPTIHKP
ncbi:MAG: hypothetical protein MHPSP_003363, partial [Paramarteilia canceri]